MHELKDTTFIIPICIESEDRYKNAKTVLGYLNHHFKTNIILHEFHDGNSKLDFLDTLTNLNIVKHIQEDNGLKYYHKTRQINEMLEFVETGVTFMHDIDAALPPYSYIDTEMFLMHKEFQIVYPYAEGSFVKFVSTLFDRTDFDKEFNLQSIPETFIEKNYVNYGYCHALKTDVYKKIGRENENFKQWGPEDEELNIRIRKFKLNIARVNSYVYHFNHCRTDFSTINHKYKDDNYSLLEFIKNLSEEEAIDYYRTTDYLIKYKR